MRPIFPVNQQGDIVPHTTIDASGIQSPWVGYIRARSLTIVGGDGTEKVIIGENESHGGIVNVKSRAVGYV